jgi:hypothetical protein
VASIYASTKVGAGYTWQLRLDYTVTQDEENNKSNIACTLYVKPGSSGGYNEDANSAYYVICGEKTYKKYNFSSTSWVKLGSRTITVEHEDDGTKSYKLSASWVSDNKTYYTPASISLSETVELPQINRGTAWVNNGTWKRCTPWLKVDGVWKRVVPWVKQNGTWKRAK